MSRIKNWWKAWWYNTKNWWTKKDRIATPHLDELPRIKLEKLRLGDIVLFFDGMWLTEAHGEWMRSVKYGRVTKAPYHTNIVYDKTLTRRHVLVSDTEIVTNLSLLEHEYCSKKESTIVVIRYPLNQAQNEQMMDHIDKVVAKEPLYGVRRYAGFLKQIPGFETIGKTVEPKGDSERVCSNRVAYAHFVVGNKVSDLSWRDTAPVDLLLYKLRNPQRGQMYVLKKKGELL